MKNAILVIFLAAAAVRAESPVAMPLPSPNQILMVQEREAGERYYANRATMAALAQKPAPAPADPTPARTLSEQERRELHEALDRFFREHPGVIIDARTGKPLETNR
jgi:hypothetical protein